VETGGDWIMTAAGFVKPGRSALLLRLAPFAFLGASVVLIASAAIVGRNAQAVAEAAERDAIAEEDERVCAELGFGRQHEGHLRCASGLAEIRRKQKERWDSAIY
jgi:hypothetical protein